MEYIILTASAIESNRLQHERWLPSANVAPVSLLARGALLGAARQGADLFYTDGALDALVRSAAVEGREWEAWRAARGKFGNVRPYEAWEYLHEASVEELAERNRTSLAVMTSTTKIEARGPSLSYLDLINYERRHCAAAVRAHAVDRLVRIAPGRVMVTESQELGVVTVRATWTALPAADRKAPEWLVNGMDTTRTLAGA